MILKLREWCEELIIAIVISIIIEMFVPEGNNQKYVKVVIGIYIVFVFLNPLLNLLNYDFNIEDVLNIETSAENTEIDENIENVYIEGIEENIKKDIEEIGYKVENVDIILDEKNENIKCANIQISRNIEKITPIIIGESQNEDIENYQDIEKILKEKYFVQETIIN